PAFAMQMESMVDVQTGRVTVNSVEKGKARNLEQTLILPADLSNGMVFTLIKNIPPEPPTTVSFLAFTPKPQVVKLTFNKQGRDKLKTLTASYSASRFVMRVEIGGIKGFLARLFRKVPPDTQVWIADQGSPTFVASEGPLYGGGPVWRIDLVSPNA